jgi:two-component system, NarL family, response regulator LiaR
MSAESRIRVLVVDDHPLAHSGMRFFLSAFADLEMVGAAHDGDEALALCARFQPAVVLMDLLMPGMDGVTATAQIRARFPQVRIIALSTFNDRDLVDQAFQAGACGYLLKNVSAFDLANAIRAAVAGRTVVAPELDAGLGDPLRRPPAPGVDLTEREREVLNLVTQGLSNQQIADRLSITRSTVKFHIGSIFTKLGIATRSEAIALAYKRRLV